MYFEISADVHTVCIKMYLSRCDQVDDLGVRSVLYDSFLTQLLESELLFFSLPPPFNRGLEIIKRYFDHLQVQTVFPD